MSKLLNYIQEKINQNKEKKDRDYATISKFSMYSDLDYKEADLLKEDLSKLIDEKKIFFDKEEYTSIGSDGSLSTYNSTKYFTDIEKYKEYENYKLNKNIENASKKINEEIEKLNTIAKLSPEAKYLYKIVDEKLKNRGFIDNKEILKESGMLFSNFKEAQDELIKNKCLYLVKNERENGDINYLLIKEDKYLAKMLEKMKDKEIEKKEEVKENVVEEKENIISNDKIIEENKEVEEKINKKKWNKKDNKENELER